MPITFADKQKMVTDLKSKAEVCLSIVAVDYCGLAVSDITKLREASRSEGVDFVVVRNRIAKRALEGTGFDSLSESFVGSTMLAFSNEAPGSAARLLKKFIKDVPAMKVKMISLGDGNLDASRLDFVASMPTRDEALSLIAMLTKAPARDVACSIKDVPGRLVRAVAALAEQKKAA